MPTPFAPTTAYSSLPQNVGIHAIDLYFPSTYISQSSLESFNSIPAGKYTIGLGQLGLSYVNDREDVYSIALSAVESFMSKYGVRYEDIGRLEVGSETILDHSKSIKSVLMQLFAASGNSDVEGIDSMNACYAGTHALFNSVDWIESSSFDGRYALVVAADIAEYASGPARPTGGCGAVVMLLGPDAPLVLDRGVRASHMEHAWDFYKPNMESPYPLVDGKFSNSCYIRALDTCYQRYVSKYRTKLNDSITVDRIDHVVLHAPYNKLTQKGYARLYWNDYRIAAKENDTASASSHSSLQQFASLPLDATYSDVTLEKQLLALSRDSYSTKVSPATLLPQHIGNMYTASLYAGLASLLYTQADALVGKRILCFSYGSGLASSIFSLHVPESIRASQLTAQLLGGSVAVGESCKVASLLQRLRSLMALEERLSARVLKSPEEFSASMEKREKLHSLDSFVASDSISELRDGSWYLVEKDSASRRQYRKKGSGEHVSVSA